MPTAQVVKIIHKTGLNIVEIKVLVLPVHSRETRLVSFETRLISFLSRRVSRETRRVSQDGGNLLLSGTVETMLFLAQGRPKVNVNRDFQSLNRLRYFYGGHLSNDIILTKVKPQVGWE